MNTSRSIVARGIMPSQPRPQAPEALSVGHRLRFTVSVESLFGAFTCDKIERPSCLGCNMGTQSLLR
jgi:hypothetical protein